MASRAERARSFGAIAGDYDRLRPGPPAAAADWLLPAHCHVAVDVGAGTGLLTRLLASKVEQVIAVEPDERMRAVLRARSPGVRVMAGTGEAIPLPGASADGVFISSAWHWMDPELAVPEIARVLADGGRLGLVWSGRDGRAGWVRDIGRLVAASTGDDADAGPPARQRPGNREIVLPPGAPFGNVATESFTFTRTMTAEGIVDMLATYSGIITASPDDRAAALSLARAELERRFPDSSEIVVPMRAWCWRADRLPRTREASVTP